MADLRLRIVQSRFQNAFFHELADVIADEAGRLGASVDVVRSQVEAEPEDVFLLLPTHEYTALEGPLWYEEPRFADRAIGLTAEQPNSTFFDSNIALSRHLAAVLDFSEHAVRAYREHDVAAEHLRFGWTPSWDVFDPEQDYERDLVFLGCLSERRERAIAGMTRLLWSRESKLVVSDNATPNWAQGPSFVAGAAKRRLLATSKVLLNVHQAETPYFEWLRAVEAAHCGAVLVSETSLQTEPFERGTHFLSAPAAGLSLAAEDVLDDPDKLKAVRTAAYELIKAHPFAESVAKLLSIAEDVRRGHGHRSALRVGPTRREPLSRNLVPPWERPRTEVDGIKQAVREIRLDMLDLRRSVNAGRAQVTEPFVDRTTWAWDRVTAPRVSVIMAMYNHGDYVAEALESVASGTLDDIEIVVTNDGSTDDSRDRVVAWMDRSPHVPAMLVTHPVNRGLPRSRNESLKHARGEYVFVLDADNSVVPNGLERLARALDEDQEAAFAYGALQRFDSTGPVGMMGLWDWEPWRLRYGNYIDAMAMVRGKSLRAMGGYTTDRRLHGWEDYDLWCRVAEAGGHAAHVPTVVGRYRTSASSMLSLTNISQDAGFDALRERVPRLMSGVLEPEVDELVSWVGEMESARTGRDAWMRSWEVAQTDG
ncbi:glycosyltransferase [Actinokineospora sp. G85]|uniref:glycosyltransferase n=1 Tax=Actinokineospora sp. G85 TaxID=3406626 RepID=UPI003C78C232